MSSNRKAIKDARKVIKKFGGIRPMATKMDVPVTTVQGWKKRNQIPGSRRADVLEAAETHNINLDDVIGTGANENSSSEQSQEQSFDRIVNQADNSPAREEQHRDAVIAVEKTYEAGAQEDKRQLSEIAMNNEAIMKQISAAERRAIQKSSLAAVILVALTAGLAFFLFWPTQEQTVKNTRAIAQLETKTEEQVSIFQKLFPDDVKQELSRLREQAEGIKQTVVAYSVEAEKLATGVLGPDAGTLNQRLERLEGVIGELSGSGELTQLINKVQELQQSVQGQEKLQQAVAALNQAVSGVQGEVKDMNEQLEAARQEQPALGETLEGVSQTDLKAASMLVALAQFRSSLHRSAPFEDDLALLQNLVGEDNPELNAAIERLAPQAEKGVLTTEGLSTQFKGLAGDIVVSSLKGEDVTVREKAKARLNELLQVEKDGELITGTDTQATVARAQKALDQGDVQAAIAELQSLEGEAAQTAQPWLDNAEKTLLAQKVEDMATGRILGQLGGISGGLQSDSLRNLVNKLGNYVPGRQVVTDEESGMAILPQNPVVP